MVQTHFRKPETTRSHPHQNVLVSRTKVKTFNKLLWTCGKQFWGTASTSNIEILELFQSKASRKILDAPWLVPITVIRLHLQTSTIKE
jgi:hypothetical protein